AAEEEDELSAVPSGHPDLEATARLQGELADDQLAMMFVACHPSLSTTAQVMLALRTLCGLEAAQIAALLLSRESAVEKALVRGRLLTLAEQDRSRWDGAMIRLGLEQLARSAAGEELTEFHLEAGIAACHALAPSFDTTDWPRIVGSYDQLLRLDPSPVIRLN